MLQQNVQLKPYNSFRTEAFAKFFIEPQSFDELRQCLVEYKSEKKLIIGGGCNLFFTQNFDGLVLKPNLRGLKILSEDAETLCVEVLASEDWDQFVQYCVERNLAGLENLSLIPGTVGASPIQNIGAYGAEVKDCIKQVTAIQIHTGETIVFSNSDCQFAYRDSLFKQTGAYVITSVVFELKKLFSYLPKYKELNQELANLTSPSIREVRDAIINIRRRKLPDHNELPNCGSFFKNPYITNELTEQLIKEFPELPIYPQSTGLIKTSAAFLIDRAGFRGKRIGNIGTYPNQALIVVNYGASDGNEIVQFKNEIQKAVFGKFGIQLDPEVRIL